MNTQPNYTSFTDVIARGGGETAEGGSMIRMTSSPLTIGLAAACFATVLGLSTSCAHAEACREPRTGTALAPLLSPPLGKVVVGTGRLQFFSAPDPRCAMAGIFVVPHDDLIAYAETPSGWSSVMYTNPRNGNSVQGWLRSTRLRTTGTEGPRQ